MSYPTWPESLPKPRREGYSVTATPSVRRIQMEAGPDRVIRTSSTTMRNAAVSFVADVSQVAEFWSFYENEANAGADWVLIPIETANIVTNHLCRIVGDVGQVKDGLDYIISFTVETDEQHIDWGV